MRTLPRWRAEDSDGCSFAPLMSMHPVIRAACIAHDERYYYGGSRDDKAAADHAFHDALIAGGMDAAAAQFAFLMVRKFGRPEGRIPGVSWAFGGERFAFDDAPAVPAANELGEALLSLGQFQSAEVVLLSREIGRLRDLLQAHGVEPGEPLIDWTQFRVDGSAEPAQDTAGGGNQN